MGIFDSLISRFKAMRSRRKKRSAFSLRKLVSGRTSVDTEHVLVGLGQSAGLERKHNEDAVLVVISNSAGELTLPDFGLFVVADGMGGHRSGEVASAIATRTVAEHLTQDTFAGVLSMQGQRKNLSPVLEVVREAMLDANRQVVSQLPGGGTTLTAAVMLGDQLSIGHVGDSRAYVITDDGMNLLTRDHTFVERLVELGEVSIEEVRNHPQRHVLYRAIGQGDTLEVDVFTHPTPHGGELMICSDGLWGVVPEDRILSIVKRASHPQDACDELIQAANREGGPDNITVVLVRFPQKGRSQIQK
jgi:serine/threonine protein phosphatase PrpC